MAGGVAHHFNNLLTVIVGYGDFLLSALPAADPLHSDAEAIRRASDRAAALTRQLLAFAGKQVLRREALDLNALVSGRVDMLRHLVGEGVELVTELKPALGQVMADPGQMEPVLVNLAANARDAMPQGGRLTLATSNVDLDESFARSHPEVRPGPYVLLAVSDTGRGMDEATRGRLFEPFLSSTGAGGRTGLGLAAAYGIVQQSGGHIDVQSEPGLGELPSGCTCHAGGRRARRSRRRKHRQRRPVLQRRCCWSRTRRWSAPWPPRSCTALHGAGGRRGRRGPAAGSAARRPDPPAGQRRSYAGDERPGVGGTAGQAAAGAEGTVPVGLPGRPPPPAALSASPARRSWRSPSRRTPSRRKYGKSWASRAALAMLDIGRPGGPT